MNCGISTQKTRDTQKSFLAVSAATLATGNID